MIKLINNGRRIIFNEYNPLHGNTVLSCPFSNCIFTTTKGERGVKIRHRKMHKAK